MADADIAPNFGQELKDAFKPVNAWVAGGITWLDEIQQFYRERSAIEKEYSAKLNGLAKKYYEKKSKKSSSLSVGDTPAMTRIFRERIPHHLDNTTYDSRISSRRTRSIRQRADNEPCRPAESSRNPL